MSTPEWLDGLSWDAIADEALEVFRDLLRIDTTNPPGNEEAACALLSGLLQEDGIEHEVFPVDDGRANLVARIRGNGDEEPLLLAGHLDVVEVGDAAAWQHPPFGAEIHDGYLWGRGTIDMKNMVAMELACLRALHRHARAGALKRDVIFAAVADEEAGCELGSLWLAREHPERVRARYAFGEFGGFTRHVGDLRICPVQIAEKGVCWLRIRARGAGGHGGFPGPDNALGAIGAAAHRLTTEATPLHVTPVMEDFVRTLASHQPFPRGLVFQQVLNRHLGEVVLRKVLPDRDIARNLYALLHNTANPTVLRAGNKLNVVPAEAELQVDGRTLPGQTDEDLIREVREIIGDGYEIEVIKSMPPVNGDPGDPVFDVIREVLGRMDPGVVVVPNLVWGFTDAKAWSSLGATCVGFSPVRLGREDSFQELLHAVDERIPVEGFRFGVRALIEVVARVAS
jgi:acetylornithine deacetylase/succinyl-diaminopimelate desuccinylase-like protein